MTKHVLVAGAGDVGMRVARMLAAQGAVVTALRRSPVASEPGVAVCAVDLADPSALRALPSGVTEVAYLPSPDARTPAAYRTVFRDGLANLLGALDTTLVRRVVFVSSSAVYGDHDGAWVDEDTPPAPLGFNGEILLEAELWLAGQGLPAVTLRLAGLYGPGRTQLVERLRRGAVVAPRQPPFWSNRIHVDDAAAAVVHLLGLANPAALYLGVDDMPLPLSELYDHLSRLLGVPLPPAGEPPVGIGSKRLRNARLRASGLVLRWPDSRTGYAALLPG